MRLPPSAKQMATEPMAIAQATKARGAYGPMLAASAAGTAKMPAPTTMLMMLAVSPQVPTARTSPLSRCCSAIGATYHGRSRNAPQVDCAAAAPSRALARHQRAGDCR